MILLHLLKNYDGSNLGVAKKASKFDREQRWTENVLLKVQKVPFRSHSHSASLTTKFLCE
jgi:hypothetical protein